MDGIEVNGEDRQAAEPSKRSRRLWTAEEKRRILREAQKPGSVRREVAQRGSMGQRTMLSPHNRPGSLSSYLSSSLVFSCRSLAA